MDEIWNLNGNFFLPFAPARQQGRAHVPLGALLNFGNFLKFRNVGLLLFHNILLFGVYPLFLGTQRIERICITSSWFLDDSMYCSNFKACM